jgi:peptidylprolyl isomerase
MSVLEVGVTGMQEGEERTFSVPPGEAFGPKRNELMSVVKKSKFPDHISPTIGQRLHLKRADGRIIDATVTEIIDGLVVLDANHPLAGQTLKITVEMIDIK